MKEGNSDRHRLVNEAKANALYLSVYVPIAMAVLAVLGLGLPYVMLGLTPSTVLRGAQIVVWGVYIIVCLLPATVLASVVWLRMVRKSLSRSQAEKIMMPMGSDPMGRWLIARHIPGSDG